jgi:hypothetical protein
MSEAVVNGACDACGQSDNHPMIHVGPAVWRKNERTVVSDPSFHFDCLPGEFEAALGQAPQHAVTLATIAAARDGVHGDDLRDFILSQPSDNDLSEED